LPENLTTVTDQLIHKGIRPSYQRAKIFTYLKKSRSHPTVDEIYAALSAQIPSLSKATVYNTLHALIEAGLVRELNIDLEAQRYDTMLEDHGHFRCVACGKIFNFMVDVDNMVVEGLQGFEVEKKDVYFTGLCPDCR